MVTDGLLENELAASEDLIRCGEFGRAMARLGWLLTEYASDSGEYGVDRARILHLMGKAAKRLNDTTAADYYYLRAVDEITPTLNTSALEQAGIRLELAEYLADRELYHEALRFAEAALECITSHSGSLAPDDAAEILKRYGEIAERTGGLDAACVAYTIGLLLLHQASGMESAVANQLASLTRRLSKAQNSGPIHQMSNYLLPVVAPSRSKDGRRLL